MTVFMLKNHNPDDFADKIEHNHSGTLTLAVLVEQAHSLIESAKTIEHEAAESAVSGNTGEGRTSPGSPLRSGRFGGPLSGIRVPVPAKFFTTTIWRV
jgi:hypothetical protein